MPEWFVLDGELIVRCLATRCVGSGHCLYQVVGAIPFGQAIWALRKQGRRGVRPIG
jgi:hypothetical protein